MLLQGQTVPRMPECWRLSRYLDLPTPGLREVLRDTELPRRVGIAHTLADIGMDDSAGPRADRKDVAKDCHRPDQCGADGPAQYRNSFSTP